MVDLVGDPHERDPGLGATAGGAGGEGVGPPAGFELVDQTGDTGGVDLVRVGVPDAGQPVPVDVDGERVAHDLDTHRAIGTGSELGHDRAGEAPATLGIAGQRYDAVGLEVEVQGRVARPDGRQRGQRGRNVVGRGQVRFFSGIEHPDQPGSLGSPGGWRCGFRPVQQDLDALGADLYERGWTHGRPLRGRTPAASLARARSSRSASVSSAARISCAAGRLDEGGGGGTTVVGSVVARTVRRRRHARANATASTLPATPSSGAVGTGWHRRRRVTARVVVVRHLATRRGLGAFKIGVGRGARWRSRRGRRVARRRRVVRIRALRGR